MKKKILTLCLVAALAATAVVGGTLAYFTDTADQQNTFTVGKVDIKLDEKTADPEDADTERTEEDQEYDFSKLMPGTEYEKDPTITVEDGSEDTWVFMKMSINKFNSWLRLVAIQNDSDTQNLMDYTDNCTNTKCAAAGHCQGHFNETNMKAFFASQAYQDAFDEWFGGMDHTAWEIMNWEEVWSTIEASWDAADIKYLDMVFGYKTVLKAGEKAVFFTSVKMPEDVTSQQMADARFNAASDWKMTFTAYAIQKDNLDTLEDAYAALKDSTKSNPFETSNGK